MPRTRKKKNRGKTTPTPTVWSIPWGVQQLSQRAGAETETETETDTDTETETETETGTGTGTETEIKTEVK